MVETSSHNPYITSGSVLITLKIQGTIIIIERNPLEPQYFRLRITLYSTWLYLRSFGYTTRLSMNWLQKSLLRFLQPRTDSKARYPKKLFVSPGSNINVPSLHNTYLIDAYSTRSNSTSLSVLLCSANFQTYYVTAYHWCTSTFWLCTITITAYTYG